MNSLHQTGIEILKRLESGGYAAVFVGGFVRDFLLDRPSSDIDIATSATPLQVKALFPKTKDTGVKYGTVTVFLNDHRFEVTTFRTEGSYQDARHPENIDYASKLEDDLVRRDFTINAIAMDASGAILDPVGGRNDLANRTIRAIGDPAIRFEEDALRMLRAFRFAAKLDFAIEPKTKLAIERYRDRLKQLPSERILDEIRTMLAQTHADRALRDMLECRLDDVFLQWGEGIRVFGEADGSIPSFETFFAVSLLNLDGDAIDAWRFSNREKTKIRRLIDLIQVTEADSFTPMLLYCYGLDLCLQADLANAARVRRPPSGPQIRLLDAALPIRRPCDLAFKGDDLLQLTGVRNARVIGQVIEEMIEAILNGALPNEREPLSAFALDRIQTLLTAEETL
jgi:tRNA nucleotidyltransferase (CCA-adding enzyme)